MTVLAAVAVAYLFMGRVFVFITRYGASRTRIGQVIVALTWPLMVLLMLTFVVIEMVSTWGDGYEEEEDEP